LHGIPSIIGWIVSIFAAIGLNKNNMENSIEVKKYGMFPLFDKGEGSN